MLKFKVTAEEYEGFEEGVQSLYKKAGKAYQLDVDGAADLAKLKEFRTNNKNLSTELSDLKEKYGDLDMEKIQGLLDKEAELEEGKLIKEGDIDGLLEKRVKKVLDPLKLQNEELATKLKTADENLARLTIDNRITKNAAKLGAHETAIDDLCTRARKVFRVDDKGHAVALDEDGDPRVGEDGKVLDIDGWLGVQKTKEAPHCFRQSSGGNEGGQHKKTTKQEGERTSHQKIQDGLKERGYSPA